MRIAGFNPRRWAWLLCWWLAAQCAGAATPFLRYEVVARYAHPGPAFTQGLALSGDSVFESSGLYGHSFTTIWSLSNSTPLARQSLPASVFGEGLTLWNERLYVLSWREQRGFILDSKTLKKLGEFAYSGEGWGLSHTGTRLIMSDGSATLRLLEPRTFEVNRTIQVTDGELPLTQLNELEWIPAQNERPARLLANIWQSDEIAVIDIEDGRVTARLDLSRIYPKPVRAAKADVLNGIAFDERDGTLLVTGKFWPHVYRIRVLDALP